MSTVGLSLQYLLKALQRAKTESLMVKKGASGDKGGQEKIMAKDVWT